MIVFMFYTASQLFWDRGWFLQTRCNFWGAAATDYFLNQHLNKSTNHFVFNVLEKSEHSLVSFFKSLRYNKDDFFVVSDQQPKKL